MLTLPIQNHNIVYFINVSFYFLCCRHQSNMSTHRNFFVRFCFGQICFAARRILTLSGSRDIHYSLNFPENILENKPLSITCSFCATHLDSQIMYFYTCIEIHITLSALFHKSRHVLVNIGKMHATHHIHHPRQ